MAGVNEIAVWCLLFVASVTDLAWGKIYNALTLPFFAFGILFHLANHDFSPTAIGVAAILFFPLYFLKVIAAGDVKLLLAFAAWMNSAWVLQLAAVSIVIGASVGFFILARKGKLDFKKGLTKMPLAPAFLCAYAFLKVAEMKGWNL